MRNKSNLLQKARQNINAGNSADSIISRVLTIEEKRDKENKNKKSYRKRISRGAL